jgi:hypothetical protein
MARWEGHQSVRLVSITHGADIEIDLSAFAEPEPVFAYVDDVGSRVEVLGGLEVAGRMTVEGQPPFMWLDGARDCVLLKATPQGIQERRAVLRSLGVSEFCVEVYRVRPGECVELVGRGDFCFK